MDPENTASAPSSQSTSLSLLERVRANDPAAWERLVDLYGPMVLAWCRRAGLADQDSEDVFQEVFRAVADRIHAFRRDWQGSTFRGWLWTVTRSKIVDHFRVRRNQPAAAGGSEAQQRWMELPEQLDESSGDSQAADDRRALVQRALAMIRPEFRPQAWQAFERFAIEGEPAGVVAGELGMSSGAVRQVKYRVFRRLREELADLLD
jgi:RNA polymerase sigma-70 factor (ECF subfamily)